MNTETLVTIDHTTLTTITGGGKNPLKDCVVHGVIGAGFGALTGPVDGLFGGIAGCAAGLLGDLPTGQSAGRSKYQRPGFPYATESRL